MTDRVVLKGQTLGFTDDPFRVGPEAAVAHRSDGAVWIEDGLIRAVGPAEEILQRDPTAPVVDYGGFVCQVPHTNVCMVWGKGRSPRQW